MKKLIAMGILSLVLAGCSKLDHESNFELESLASRSIHISAPTYEQKIKLTYSSSEVPVGVWIILDKDIPGDKEEFDPETLKSGVIAKEKDKKEGVITATIPAKENYTIVVSRATKKTQVKIKLTNG